MHDAASGHASKINNRGLEAQIGYLIEAFGPKGARSVVEDCRRDPLAKNLYPTEALRGNADRDTLCIESLNGQERNDGRRPSGEDRSVDDAVRSEPPPSTPDSAATTTQEA
ncbi:hypothetical protein [Actinomadura violacea]|uniref:Uncharacterized protein n=1 Tax=Actinomadura violacea TaxID=2819934 RepID=A0ABS3RZN8_9ACTN|nr:hypothetical protein [Actinomadura violacea]MBO2461485.1 hypothetical protein [Actinomadura violacea]